MHGKTTRIKGLQMASKTTIPVYIYLDHIKFRSIDDLKKVNKYCSRIFGKSVQEKSSQLIDDFIIKIMAHIKSAEIIHKKDYLEIKE